MEVIANFEPALSKQMDISMTRNMCVYQCVLCVLYIVIMYFI